MKLQLSRRILLIDSSVPRAHALCQAIAKAGWEIWPARNVQDALVLAAGLPFGVVLAHEAATRQYPDLWGQLVESLDDACWLLHGDTRRATGSRSCGVLRSDPVLILSVLTLLFEGRSATRAQAA